MYVRCKLCRKSIAKNNFKNHWINCYKYYSIMYLQYINLHNKNSTNKGLVNQKNYQRQQYQRQQYQRQQYQHQQYQRQQYQHQQYQRQQYQHQQYQYQRQQYHQQHKQEHKQEHRKEHKQEHKKEHKQEHRKEHKQEHRKEHKQEHRKEHRQEHRQEHKQEHRKEHRQEHKQDHRQEHQQHKKLHPQELQLQLLPQHQIKNKNILVKCYNTINYENMLGKLLYNSSVVIVGPSSTIKNSKQGKFIDDHDIVIRLNRAIPIMDKLKVDIGSKTTIIYSNLEYNSDSKRHLNFKKFKKNKIKFLCSPYPPIEPFKKDIDRYLNEKYQLPFHHLPMEDYFKTKSVLGCRPYTGMSAIIDIIRYNIKSLYVTGIDFYANDYYNEYRNKNTYNLGYIRNNKIHNSRAHLNFIKYLSLTNPKVKIDKPLENIVYKRYKYCLNKLYKKIVNNTLNDNIKLEINKNDKICIIMNTKKINKKPNINFEYKILIYPTNNDIYDNYNLLIDCNNTNISESEKYDKILKISSFNKEAIKYINTIFNKVNINVSSDLIIILLLLFTFVDKKIYVTGSQLKKNKSLEEILFYRYLIKINLIKNVN